MESKEYSATTRTTVSEGPGIGFDRPFLLSLPGILKLGVILSAFCLGISSIVPPFTWNRSGIASYSAFVGWQCLVCYLIVYLFYMFRLVPKLPGPIGLVLMIYLLIDSIFLAIAGILCAVVVAEHKAPAAAAAAFALLALVLNLAIGATKFSKWRAHGREFHRAECGHTFSSSSTTTTAAASSDRY